MAIPAEVDIGLVLDKIRPGASYKRYKTYQDVIDTWEDQVQVLPTEQEILDGWVLVQDDQTTQTAIDAVQSGAKTQFENVPNWATWDETTALAWFDANVTTVADALPVIRNLVRMVIALRNQQWPDLEA